MKPYTSRRELLKILVSGLTASAIAPLLPILPPPLDLEKLTAKRPVVVCDTISVHLLEDVVEILGFEGIHTVGFHYTSDALLTCRTQPVSLLITDILVPRGYINGLEMVRLLKSDRITKHIPVMFLTARTDKQDREIGLNAGADKYVTKPFYPLELIHIVREHLITRVNW